LLERHQPLCRGERDGQCGLLSCCLAGGERVCGRDRDRAAAVGADERRGRLAAEGLDARDRGVVERRHPRLARQCSFDIGRELAPFFGFADFVALLELGHDPLSKDFERLADMLVAVGSALLDEHDLVDPGLLAAAQMRPQLVGGADAAAPGILRQLVLDLQKALPEIGPAGSVLAEERVIAERVAEEAEPVEPAPADPLAILAKIARSPAGDCPLFGLCSGDPVLAQAPQCYRWSDSRRTTFPAAFQELGTKQDAANRQKDGEAPAD
jgi:hypothetical protein